MILRPVVVVGQGVQAAIAAPHQPLQTQDRIGATRLCLCRRGRFFLLQRRCRKNRVRQGEPGAADRAQQVVTLVPARRLLGVPALRAIDKTGRDLLHGNK